MFVMKFASGCVAAIMSTGYGTYDLPKERLEIISDHGGITVQEFVELRAFGQEGREPVYRFAGHTHPDREYTHRGLFESLGEDALFAVRRMYMEHEAEKGEPATPERAYFDRYHAGHVPLVNYAVDKGWIASIDHFAECIATGRTPENATPHDALQASLLAQAGIRSRETGEVVAF